MKKNEHLSKFYSDNKDKLVKRLAKRVGENDAEDVVQEAFFRASRFYHSWDISKGPFSRWLEGILRRCVQDCLKEQRTRGGIMVRSSEDLPESLQPAYDDSEPEVQEEVTKVYSKIMEKSYPNRDILYMYYFAGHSSLEISQVLEVSYGVVRQVIHRFKKEVNRGGHNS